MKNHKIYSLLYPSLLVSLIVLSNCTPFRSKSNAGLSPPPPPVPFADSLPPDIRPSCEPSPAPLLLGRAVETATHMEETTAVLRLAEQHFQNGERFFKQGDTASARASFDDAIEMLLDADIDAWDRHRIKEMHLAMVEAIYRYDVEGLYVNRPEYGLNIFTPNDVSAVTFPVDPNIEMGAKDVLKLPVSDLPLELNDVVMKYIRYFSTLPGREVLVEGFQRHGRYRAMIQRILDEEGIPQDLQYIALVESKYKPSAVSRKRATGIWQFTSLGAREYGLIRTRYYDDRRDPEKATRAAARHLRDLYERFGDWYLAMAAYNAGPGRIDGAVRRTGYADFWELYYRRALPRETRNFVPKILAIIIMAKNRVKYGLEKVVPDEPLEYNSIQVTAATHLELIADILGRPASEIKELNPAIRRDVAPAGYTVNVPKGTSNFVISALEAVPASKRSTWRFHRVGYGDTLSAIADLYMTKKESIAVANGGVMRNPEAGDLLVIPVSYSFKIRSSKSSSQRSTKNRTPATASSSAIL